MKDISTDRRALAKLLAAAVMTGVAAVAAATQASAEAKPQKKKGVHNNTKNR